MSEKINFTIAALERLEATNKTVYFFDAKTRGLSLRVTPTGCKTFVFSRKINGRAERITLGRFPDLKIEQARGMAGGLSSDLAQGEDVLNRDGKTNVDMTLGALFDLCLDRHFKPYLKSWANVEKQFNKHLKDWKTRKLSEITRADVQARHAKIGKESGIYAANAVMRTLRKVFNLAIDWGFPNANPVARFKAFKETSRSRFLSPAEMQKFLTTLQDFPSEPWRDIFFTALLTGARIRNVMAMRWNEINMESNVWTIPGDKMKNSEEMRVPLVPEMVELLKERKRYSGGTWVFPGNKDHARDYRAPWQHLCEAVGVEELHVHDLRRSVGSWLAAGGASMPIIGKALGHLDAKSTQVYARLDLDPVRAALENATSAMLATAGLKNTAEIADVSASRNQAQA